MKSDGVEPEYLLKSFMKWGWSLYPEVYAISVNDLPPFITCDREY
jgi:hypothetical protein